MLVAFLPVINHLLRREPWARARLAPFAGRTMAFDVPPLGPLVLRVATDGTLERAAAGEATHDLHVTVPAKALAAPWTDRDALLAAMQVSGNAEFAAAVQFVARHLRWDAEDDLARLVGDIPARRIAQTAARFGRWQREARDRMTQNIAEYVIEEAELTVRKRDLETLAAAITAVDRRLDALEQRLEQLVHPTKLP